MTQPASPLTRVPAPHDSATATHARRSWFAAVVATAATYFYFLIFAEFAFLEIATTVTAGASQLRLLLAALGIGGVAGAILGARRFRPDRARAHLQWTLRACAAAALLAFVATSPAAILVAALSAGLSLGWLTVTLAATLRAAAGPVHTGLCIGLGTGLAYAACNVPALFQATPRNQALAAVAVAALASFTPRWMHTASESPPASPNSEYTPLALTRWIAVLLALVWMDSAVFYIIQHAPALRAATWGDPASLYFNAITHLVASVLAGVALDRHRRGAVAITAVGALAIACLVLRGTLPGLAWAGLGYAAGVSLYSALLVEFPARSGNPRIAAAMFALAGWGGSALGIGMAQDLGGIPIPFVILAPATVLAALAWRAAILRRIALGAALLVGVSALPSRGADTAVDADPLITRGREVYIAEGCIHCHSQFVRPRAPDDVERWGPVTPLSDALSARPPLFGTRRQGPDLAHVGNRRSPAWNRLHLIAPHAVSPGSRMPSYAHLFAADEDRGEALIAYLASLGAETVAERRAQIAEWTPATERALEPAAARTLFLRLCSSCHGETGRGDGPLAGRLGVRPPDWNRDGWRHARSDTDIETQLARIIKFGLPGLAMAGHEYLPDAEVVGLARFVKTLHNQGAGVPTAALQP